METFKKIAGALLAVMVVMTLMFTSLSAQNIPTVAMIDNFGTTSEDNKLKISWSNLKYKNAHYFIVEKLDENWDYQLVGKVSAHPMNVVYSMIDQKPKEGENYYRITVVTLQGEQLLSELMVADHFEPTPAIDFLPEVSKSMIAMTLIENSLKDSDLTNPKYSAQQLALNRALNMQANSYRTNQLASNNLK